MTLNFEPIMWHQCGFVRSTEAQVADQRATYNKAFSACMEGKGYTVK